MFKAIKESKIIAVNETGAFPCLVYDSVEEDTEHQVSDYVHCDGEFVLTTSDPAIEQYKQLKRNEQFACSDEMNKELQNDPDVKSRYKKPSPKELVQLRNPDYKFVNAPCAKIGWSRSPVVDVTDRRVPDWKKFLKKDGG